MHYRGDASGSDCLPGQVCDEIDLRRCLIADGANASRVERCDGTGLRRYPVLVKPVYRGGFGVNPPAGRCRRLGQGSRWAKLLNVA